MAKVEIIIESNDGEEEVIALPARNIVCPTCEGEGAHLHPDIGSHAFTTEEFEREFDDEQRAAYLRRGGMYDVTCTQCGGRNVVPEIDRAACTTPKLKQALKAFDEQRREEARYRELVESEIRFGC